MDDTYNKRENHASCVSGNLVREEEEAHRLEHFPFCDVDGEEGVKEKSHHNRSYAKGNHKRSQALETVHFLQGQSYENEDEAISGVSHAKCEEQQEENGNEGSGVEAVVCWTSVHVREDLEHLDKLVVLEADGRIVLHLCLFLDVEETAIVKFT